MRINRYLSQAGICSKREADRWILSGRVRVNGELATVGMKVTATDQVWVDAEEVKNRPAPILRLYHKPVGVVCSHAPNVPNNLPSQWDFTDRVFAIGRLDKDSEGLLLLTNQGDWVNRILRAEFAHPKEYRVWLEQAISDEALAKMAAGIEILGQTTLPCQIERLADNAYKIVLQQGLNRQIRRMAQAVGHRVVRLQRVRMLHFELADLPQGQWRDATETEIAVLQGALKYGA